MTALTRSLLKYAGELRSRNALASQFAIFRFEAQLKPMVKKARPILIADSTLFAATSPHQRVAGNAVAIRDTRNLSNKDPPSAPTIISVLVVLRLPELDPGQRSGVPSKRIALDAEPLQDGDEELRQRKLLHFHLAGPSRITGDPCAGLIVFIAFAELEIATVGEAEVLATGGNDRIVA